MEIGQVVDYITEYNRMHKLSEKAPSKDTESPTVRKATQADWDAFMG